MGFIVVLVLPEHKLHRSTALCMSSHRTRGSPSLSMDSPLELRPQIRDSYLGLCFGPASLLEPLSSLLALDEPSLTPPAQGLPTPVTGPLWKGTGTAGGPSAGPEAGEAPARRLFASCGACIGLFLACKLVKYRLQNPVQ